MVHPSSPWKTVKDFVDDAKANPGKINYAHTGAGGLPHLAGELFMLRSGIKLTGVSYRSGGEADTAVLSQNVQATFENIAILRTLIGEGKLRGLGAQNKDAHAAAAGPADHGGGRCSRRRGQHVLRCRRRRPARPRASSPSSMRR